MAFLLLATPSRYRTFPIWFLLFLRVLWKNVEVKRIDAWFLFRSFRERLCNIGQLTLSHRVRLLLLCQIVLRLTRGEQTWHSFWEVIKRIRQNFLIGKWWGIPSRWFLLFSWLLFEIWYILTGVCLGWRIVCFLLWRWPVILRFLPGTFRIDGKRWSQQILLFILCILSRFSYFRTFCSKLKSILFSIRVNKLF